MTSSDPKVLKPLDGSGVKLGGSGFKSGPPALAEGAVHESRRNLILLMVSCQPALLDPPEFTGLDQDLHLQLQNSNV